MKTGILTIFLFFGGLLSNHETKAQSENAILGVWFNKRKQRK